MIGYLYSWKGPKKGLLAYVVNTALIYKEDSINDSIMESSVPTSKYSIYNPPKDPTIFTDKGLMSLEDIPSIITLPKNYNYYGDYAINKDLLKMKSWYSTKSEPTYFKTIIRPGNWYERLLIMSAVYQWRCLLERISIQYLEFNSSYKSYFKLEKNIYEHKEYLLTLKYLPSIYNWYKVMDLFKDDEIKPEWYYHQLQIYKEKIGEM